MTGTRSVLRALLARAIVGVGVVLCAACGGGDGAPPDADLGCTGTPPPIEDCPRGYFFAECGGDGDPRLACSEGAESSCYWFTGGCIARGFEPTTCALDDLCCHESPSGSLGFPFPPDVAYTFVAWVKLYGLGVLPWNRTRAMNLDVVVDGTLTGGEPQWTCEGSSARLASGGPCGASAEIATFGGYAGAVLVLHSYHGGFGGWSPLIEVDPTTLHARLCALFFIDYGIGQCPEAEASCAASGNLTVSRLPATTEEMTGLTVAADVVFADGFHLVGSFALP